MKDFIIQNLMALGTGGIVGIVFALVRLPAPSPNIIAGVTGIFGITLGYMLVSKFITG